MPPQRTAPTHKTRTELTPYDRGRIIGMRNAGLSQYEIYRQTGIPRTTVQRTIECDIERESGASKPRSGRPRISTTEQDKVLVDYVKSHPDAIYGHIRADLCPFMSLSTIKRRLHEENLRKWRKMQRPSLHIEHAVKRLAWAQEHIKWKISDWKKVVWSDECSVERGKGLRREWVFRTPADKWKPFAIQPRSSSGCVSVMVWAAFSGIRRSQLVVMEGDIMAKRGGVTGRVYREMLEEELPTIMDVDSIFMQDNAPIHTCKLVKEWFTDMGFTVMDWPPYSPDLNPIEHCWFPLKENAHVVRDGLLDSVEGRERIISALKEALPDAWDEIPRKRLLDLIRSMRRRCKAVIDADGWWTKY
jgi:hypothetical protein